MLKCVALKAARSGRFVCSATSVEVRTRQSRVFIANVELLKSVKAARDFRSVNKNREASKVTLSTCRLSRVTLPVEWCYWTNGTEPVDFVYCSVMLRNTDKVEGYRSSSHWGVLNTCYCNPYHTCYWKASHLCSSHLCLCSSHLWLTLYLLGESAWEERLL